MYDVDVLEKEWKRYKIKQTLPWIGFSFLLSLIFIYLLNREYIFNEINKFFPKDENKREVITSVVVKEVTKPVIEKPKKVEKCIDVNSTEIVKVVKVKKKIVAKDKNVTKDIIKENIVVAKEIITDDEYNEEIDKEIDKIKAIEPKMKIEFVEDSEIIEDKPENMPHRRKYLNIIVTDKDSLNEDSSKIFDTLSIVETRYKNSPNYQDALYLAEGYYQQGEYSISQKWSLISNNLNSNSEESWLIFAKSKAKLGEYKVAEDILEAYLKENSSNKAEKLLKMMQLGKF
jgi:hypothetical protein